MVSAVKKIKHFEGGDVEPMAETAKIAAFAAIVALGSSCGDGVIQVEVKLVHLGQDLGVVTIGCEPVQSGFFDADG